MAYQERRKHFTDRRLFGEAKRLSQLVVIQSTSISLILFSVKHNTFMYNIIIVRLFKVDARRSTI